MIIVYKLFDITNFYFSTIILSDMSALIVCDANILPHRGKEFCFGYMRAAIPGGTDFKFLYSGN